MDDPILQTEGLYQKTLQGGVWVFGGKVIEKCLVFAKVTLLARFLSPGDFGVLAIAFLIINMLEVFTETGFQKALIQRAGDISKYLDAVWTVNVFKGFLLFLLLFFSAPLVVFFFDAPGTFEPDHIQQPMAICQALQNPKTPLMRFLSEEISADILQSAGSLSFKTETKGVGEKELREAISREFNIVIRTRKLYSSDLLEGIPDSATLLPLLKKERSGDVSVRLNRLVLEHYWPKEIRHVMLNRPRVTWIIRIVSLTLFVGGFSNVRTVYWTRNLRFKKRFQYDFIQQLSGITIVLLLVFLRRDVWGLAFGTLLGSIVGCIWSYLFLPCCPRLVWDLSYMKELWSYGKHIFGISVLTYLTNWGDDLVVAKLLGPAALGYYRYAYHLAHVPATEVAGLIGQVSFPVYSKLQNQIQKLRSGYEKATMFVALCCFPITAVLFVMAEDLTWVLFGREWLPIVPAVRVVSFLGLLKCSQTGYVFQAIGRPDISFKIGLVRLGVMICLLYPLTKKYGIVGTSFAALLACAVIFPIALYHIKKSIHHTYTDFFRAIRAPLIASVLMGVWLWLLSKWLYETKMVFVLLKCISGAIVYGGALYVFGLFAGQDHLRDMYRDFYTALKPVLPRFSDKEKCAENI